MKIHTLAHKHTHVHTHTCTHVHTYTHRRKERQEEAKGIISVGEYMKMENTRIQTQKFKTAQPMIT